MNRCNKIRCLDFKNLISCRAKIKYIMDLFFRLNSHVVRFLERRKKNSSALRNGAATNAELDDGCDATAVLLKKGNLFVSKAFNS